MAVRLSRSAYQHAQTLIKDLRVVLDGRDDWSEHRPSAQQEYEYLEEHGYAEYGPRATPSSVSSWTRIAIVERPSCPYVLADSLVAMDLGTGCRHQPGRRAGPP